MPISRDVDSRAMRSHNEGSIYPRTRLKKDGTPVVFQVAAVSLPDGRRITRWTRSKAAARDALKDLLRERDEGKRPQTLSLGRFLERWTADVEATVRPETARHYRLHVAALITGLGSIALPDLSVPDVNAHLAALKLSPQSRKHRRAVLRRALNDAMRQDLVRVNVAALSRAPKVERAPITPLTLAEAHRLIAETTEDRLHALLRLALETGQRESELVALTWPDIDIPNRTVTIAWALGRDDKGIVRVPTKTTGSKHIVPITAETAEALRVHRIRQHAERLASGHGGEYEGYAFTRPGGTPYYSRALLREFYPILTRLGLPLVKWHALRHTTATLLLSLGYSLEDVKQLLGHSSIGITSDSYSHAVPTRLRAVVDGLGQAIGG